MKKLIFIILTLSFLFPSICSAQFATGSNVPVWVNNYSREEVDTYFYNKISGESLENYVVDTIAAQLVGVSYSVNQKVFINYPFINGIIPYVPYNGSGLQTIMSVYFSGTESVGIPKKISVVYKCPSAGGTHVFTAHDITNNKQICSGTLPDTTAVALYSFNTLTNLPAKASVIELRLNLTGTTTTRRTEIYNSTIEFN